MTERRANKRIEEADVRFIMERRGDDFVMYGCRGSGRGCSRNKYRSRKKHCEDCLLADPKETVENFQKRLSGSDA